MLNSSFTLPLADRDENRGISDIGIKYTVTELPVKMHHL